MTFSPSSVILCDNGQSYVVPSLPLKGQVESEGRDSLGRTNDQKKFLELFINVFTAASNGSLESCKKFVEEGFSDFDAYSVCYFKPSDGVSLDYISSMKIAEKKGYADVVQYFNKVNRERAKERYDKLDEKFQQFKDQNQLSLGFRTSV